MPMAHSYWRSNKKLDELPRADHLGNEIKNYDRNRAHRRRNPYRLLAQAICHHVGKRVFAHRAQRSGD